MDLPYSITITVPPLGGLVLRPDPLPKPVLLLAEETEVDEEPLDLAANDEDIAQPE